jgi:hypothetical protein
MRAVEGCQSLDKFPKLPYIKSVSRNRQSLDLTNLSAKTLALFRSQLDVDGDCIVWKGKTEFRSGYGIIYIDRISVYVHRLAWSIARGPIPPGLMIRHRCPKNNKLCVLHLDIGTAQDNGRDLSDDRLSGVSPPSKHSWQYLQRKK